MDTDLLVSEVPDFPIEIRCLKVTSTDTSASGSARKDLTNSKATHSPRTLKTSRPQTNSIARTTHSKSRSTAQTIKPQNFEVFPTSESTSKSNNKSATSSTGGSKSLKDVDFNVRAPQPTRNIGMNNAAAASTSSSKNQAFLASLRSQTIVEMPVMREFSLIKTKPKEERNLSKLSAQALYNLRVSVLKLASEAENKETTPSTEPWKTFSTGATVKQEATIINPPTSHPLEEKQDAEEVRNTGRQSCVISFNKEFFLSKRQLVQAPPSKEESSSLNTDSTAYFPTRMKEMPSIPKAKKPPVTSSFSGSSSPIQQDLSFSPSSLILQHSFAQGVHYRTNSQIAIDSPPSPSPPLPRSSSLSPTPRKTPSSGRVNSTNKRATNQTISPANPTKLLVWQDLSEFDQRKCHASTAIHGHHGFLSDQNIQELMQTTGYTRQELYALWTRFKALCSISKSPEGVDKDTLHRGIPQLSVEDQFFIDRVFNMLDSDGSGILEWKEFIEALSALERGDMQTRIQFLFRVYDLNGDGSITRNEVMQFFLSSLLVQEITPDMEDVAKHFVEKIFDSVGCQDKEFMQVEDAMRFMLENPQIKDIYSLFGRTMVTTTVTSTATSTTTTTTTTTTTSSSSSSSSSY